MTSELTKAHAAFIQEVGTIGKDGDAQFGKHATLQGVLGVINPSLSRQGLSVHQVFDYTEDGKTVLRTILRHTSGEEVISSALFPSTSGRNPLHDWGSNTTYMRRFCLLAILGIAPGIDDNDGDHATSPESSDILQKINRELAGKPVISKPIVATPTQAQPDITKRTPPADTKDRDSLHDQIRTLFKENPSFIQRFNDEFRKEFPKAKGNLPGVIQDQQMVSWALQWFSKNS